MRSTTSVLSLACCCSRHGANRGPVAVAARPAPDRAPREPRAAPEPPGSAGTDRHRRQRRHDWQRGHEGRRGHDGDRRQCGHDRRCGHDGHRRQRGHNRRCRHDRHCRSRRRYGQRGTTGAAGRGGNAGSAAGTGGATTGTGGGAGTMTAACAPPTTTLSGTDAVAGTKITFNDNGGWCWYQDERAIVDTKAGKLIIGSVGSGGNRTGNIEAVVYDLAAGTKIGPTKIGNLSVDDHNAPAFNIRPDGKYVATWATHRTDCNTYYSIFDGSAWASDGVPGALGRRESTATQARDTERDPEPRCRRGRSRAARSPRCWRRRSCPCRPPPRSRRRRGAARPAMRAQEHRRGRAPRPRWARPPRRPGRSPAHRRRFGGARRACGRALHGGWKRSPGTSCPRGLLSNSQKRGRERCVEGMARDQTFDQEKMSPPRPTILGTPRTGRKRRTAPEGAFPPFPDLPQGGITWLG